MQVTFISHWKDLTSEQSKTGSGTHRPFLFSSGSGLSRFFHSLLKQVLSKQATSKAPRVATSLSQIRGAFQGPVLRTLPQAAFQLDYVKEVEAKRLKGKGNPLALSTPPDA